MDLYVWGNNQLLQPEACDRYFTDKSNQCKHVPSGLVNNSSACPYMTLAPTSILQDQLKIDVRPLAAESIIVTNSRYLHGRDDETLEESTVHELLKHTKNEDIQDIWYVKGEEKSSFGPRYLEQSPAV